MMPCFNVLKRSNIKYTSNVAKLPNTEMKVKFKRTKCHFTRVGTTVVATIYIQLIQNRYMFRSFTVLQCNHQHCLQPVASDVEVVGYI